MNSFIILVVAMCLIKSIFRFAALANNEHPIDGEFTDEGRIFCAIKFVVSSAIALWGLFLLYFLK